MKTSRMMAHLVLDLDVDVDLVQVEVHVEDKDGQSYAMNQLTHLELPAKGNLLASDHGPRYKRLDGRSDPDPRFLEEARLSWEGQ